MLRLMEQKDMRQVLRIENANFERPWTRRDFNEYIDKQYLKAVVAVSSMNEVVGYITFGIGDNIEISNLAVASESRRTGLGALLVASAITPYINHFYYAQAIVSEANLNAQLFFKNLGFTERPEIISGHYRGRNGERVDGYLMRYQLKRDRIKSHVDSEVIKQC